MLVTLDRPASRNALNRAVLEGFAELKGRVLERGVRALIITGSGQQAFCSGADLKERLSMNDTEVRAQLSRYVTDVSWIAEAPVLTVAAVNGVALGGGLELALLCDLRVCSSNAVFGLPETSLGIIPGAGGTQRLPRLIGQARAMEVILLGRRLTASEALECGLANRVVSEDALGGRSVAEETLAWLQPVLEGSRVAQTAALNAVRAAAEKPLEQGLDLERRMYDRCLASDDRKEALAAFREKRKPRFGDD